MHLVHDVLSAEVPDADGVRLPVPHGAKLLDQDAVRLLRGILALFAAVQQPLHGVGLPHLGVAEQDHLRLPDGDVDGMEIVLDQLPRRGAAGGFVIGLVKEADRL